MRRKLSSVLSCAVISVLLIGALNLSGCEFLKSEGNSMKGGIVGNEYIASFYSNDGQNIMTMHGERIDLKANTVKVYDYGDSSYHTTESSVVSIIIDGHEMENCGSTVIFAEDGLTPDANFELRDINSTSDGSVGDTTFVAGIVNTYKNYFGKSRVVVIQSQLGNPICAFSGDSVYYEVCSDLPKTTKLSIDGKLLYIHRANFQIIDRDLLN